MIKKEEAFKVLNENILGFWHRHMIDVKNGGFFGRMDGQGVLDEEADKSLLLNARILWTFSAAFSLTGNPKHKLMADRAYEYIVGNFIDNQFGGVYWMLDYTGKVIDQNKLVCAQSFAIYGLTEYHKINPYRRAIDHASRIYEYMEKFGFDLEKNGYYESLSKSWGQVVDPAELSSIDTSKTIKTHLHILEAYTNLYSIWRNQSLKRQLENLIELITTRFMGKNGHMKLIFDRNWKLKSHGHVFGHDMEASWLLYETATKLKDEHLVNSVKEVSMKLIEAGLEGLDKDGGLMYRGGSDGISETDKYWWSQAEAMVGLVNAWQITHDQKYMNLLLEVWRFIREDLIDPEGEWHWCLDKNRVVNKEGDKAGPWKCPYHNGRALLEIIHRQSPY